MTMAVFLARARKAMKMPPRQLLARAVDSAEQQWRRPWASVYPYLLTDAAIIGESGAASLDALWTRQLSQPFFLQPSDRQAYADAFRRDYASEAAELIVRADRALRHEFDLLGSGLQPLGARLPWLDDFKTGRHYPLQYWRDIAYMELDKPTDVKVPWELSRCQHFTTLGQAYWLTGDERYAAEYRAEIEDWIAVNPFAHSVNWSCAMDVALRAINWIWGLYFMGGSKACGDAGFRRRMLRSLFTHGEFVFKHLERGDVNGNHYLSDGAGLVFLGLFFKHTAAGRRWLDQGRRIVIDEMPAQVSVDGVDFEQSTAYHRLVLELFFTSYLLLERHGETLPAPELARLARMLDFVAAYTKPNGQAPLFGDADDGRVQKLGTQSTNDHRYWLSTGAVRFENASLKTAAGRFWSESFWLLGPGAADAFRRLPAGPSGASVAFPEGGFYILRNASSHAVIDCGEVGMLGRGGHGHNDITSFELFLDGVNVVSDCGAYLYTASREWRNRFRSTAFHNVAQVGDEELNRFMGLDALWQLQDDARPVGVRWSAQGAGGYFCGGHRGYQRLSPPVECRREIWMDAERPCVALRDRLEGAGDRRVTWRFHLDPAVAVEIDGGDCRLAVGGRELWMLGVEPDRRPRRIEPGWVSPSYGVRCKTNVIVIEQASGPAELSCIFSGARLDDEARQRVLSALDQQRAAIH
jgi:uncharacterized heparinase superfamily protein